MKKTMLLALAAAALVGCSEDPDDTSAATGMAKINHLVVIYLENHSFDNLYGQFAGAEGLAQAATSGNMLQVDNSGQVYAKLPPVYDSSAKMADARFPATLANSPF